MHKIILAILAGVAIGAFFIHSQNLKDAEQWEALSTTGKIEVIDQRRIHDRHCLEGEYIEKCNEMYDDQIIEVIKNQHGGN